VVLSHDAFVHAPEHGRRAIVFTDLDSTLLERDGSILPRAALLVRRLFGLGIPVVPVTSKTRREVVDWLSRLGIPGPAIFENGAGVLFASGARISPEARSAVELRGRLSEAVRAARIAVKLLTDISEAELESLTGLSPQEQADARSREFSIPFLMDEKGLARLEEELREPLDVSLVRGGRFWHLMGRHTKADFFPAVREECGALGTSIGLGDAPNDIPILASVDLPVLIPGVRGVSAELARRFPSAFMASQEAGAGWCEAIERLVTPLHG
jgi:mannosyl-3-phosphoglycerate phosphatase